MHSQQRIRKKITAFEEIILGNYIPIYTDVGKFREGGVARPLTGLTNSFRFADYQTTLKVDSYV